MKMQFGNSTNLFLQSNLKENRHNELAAILPDSHAHCLAIDGFTRMALDLQMGAGPQLAMGRLHQNGTWQPDGH